MRVSPVTGVVDLGARVRDGLAIRRPRWRAIVVKVVGERPITAPVRAHDRDLVIVVLKLRPVLDTATPKRTASDGPDRGFLRKDAGCVDAADVSDEDALLVWPHRGVGNAPTVGRPADTPQKVAGQHAEPAAVGANDRQRPPRGIPAQKRDEIPARRPAEARGARPAEAVPSMAPNARDAVGLASGLPHLDVSHAFTPWRPSRARSTPDASPPPAVSADDV